MAGVRDPPRFRSRSLPFVDTVLHIIVFDEPWYAVKFSCKSTAKFTNAVLRGRCVRSTMTLTIYHPVGTCRMGRWTTPVSLSIQACELKGSRIGGSDASIRPHLMSSNTNTPTSTVSATADLIPLHCPVPCPPG
jgi:hypothetical protein